MRGRPYTIAGLMGAVLIASLGMAALSRSTQTWAGVTLLVTCGVLALATVGAVYGGRTERIGWLGFTLFGWGYLALALWARDRGYELPTIRLLEALAAKDSTAIAGWTSAGRGLATAEEMRPFREIGHCLWAVALAVLGGVLAHASFAMERGPTDPPHPAPPEPADAPAYPSTWRWVRHGALFLGAVVLALAVFVGTNRYPALFVGATLLITWGVIGTAALSGMFSHGRKRVRWLGATLFGAGYMLLVFGLDSYEPTWCHLAIDNFLRTLCPWILPVEQRLPPSSPEMAAANERILKALEQPIPMHFPNETPLGEVIRYIERATRGPHTPAIPIFVDPIGLQESEKSLKSPIKLEIEGVPLKRSLRLLLNQVDLTYEVNEGLIVVSSLSTADYPYVEDPLLPVGHCLLALLATGVGGLVAPLVAGPRGAAPSPAG